MDHDAQALSNDQQFELMENTVRIRMKHTTSYHFGEPVALGPHIIRLHPTVNTRAKLLSYNFEVNHECQERWQYDPWSNKIVRLTFPAEQACQDLVFTVDAAFEIMPVNPFDFFIDDRCETLPFTYPDKLENDLRPFFQASEPSAILEEYLISVPKPEKTIDFLVEMNQKLSGDFKYLIRTEAGVQTSEETLTKKSGSCRDLAVLAVDILRAQGLAARFVSGYLVQLEDEGIIPDVKKGMSSDVVDLHAWAEAYIPGAGWVGLDATSGLLCGEGHIPLACTAIPELAAAISGTTSSPAKDFSFDMEIERLGHEPRPRKPYTQEQWEALKATGRDVDQGLLDANLKLTVGGEPTFTSRTHPNEPEWNTEAMGETKWQSALTMGKELQQRFGAGCLVLHRMGKWYPGESLPRWGMELIWRQDNVPVWRDASRMVFQGKDEIDAEQGVKDSKRFLETLLSKLDLPGRIHTAYEDPWPSLRDEQELPVDADPRKAKLDDPEERRRLSRILGRGLGTEAGFVLPLTCIDREWTSQEWTFRRENLYLLPGDSPIGLRLPLKSLSGKALDISPEDKTAPQEPLAFDPERPAPIQSHRKLAPEMTEQDAKKEFCGALCVECRAGAITVFLPPLSKSEDFLRLVAAIEDASVASDIPVRLEGYGPASDPRIQSCLITPDPGVIEVNLPVCRSIDEYIEKLDVISDAANHADLSLEKYQLDGREVGTGGGNHITLGGTTTLESPFLQQPHLLGSLLRYVQNHPSLSYLFTGLFVGPTSQAPRIDEARHDALYELDVALAQIPKPGEGEIAPWLTDRLFRNLLVDVSGNTHRAEICIDKLYSPSGVQGRMGIVELRAFEMPPHQQMSAAQVLLLRALLLRFAKNPFEAPLTRWGTALHDRFLLPHYLWNDFQDIVRDLSVHGIDLKEEWYQPFVDYRFPVAGTLRINEMNLELRQALEPWPVLGEEATGATVSRYVDSSLERLQVRFSGRHGDRYQVTVNGLEVPLIETANGEFVGGVRYRAWQPPHCLQPNIGIHHPLRFDIVDTWGKRSLGSCTYHVWHPEGRGFDKAPLTAFEAAARRSQRFSTSGHSPYPVKPIPTKPHPEFPCTLDLRRYPGDRPQPR